MNPFNTIPKNPLTPEEEQRLALLDTDNARAELVMRAMSEAEGYTREVSKGHFPDDELFSMSYEALTRAAKNFKPGKQRFFPYAKAYCRGAVFKAWRSRDTVKNSYEHRTPIENDKAPRAFASDSVPFEFGSIHVKELWAQIEPVMDKVLTDQEKTVFTLRYSAGYTFAGIGKLLGVSGNAAEGSHARALKKIRRALTGKTALFSS